MTFCGYDVMIFGIETWTDAHTGRFLHSAATDLRWGANFNKFLFRNSLLYIAVKKYENWSIFSRVITKINVSCFYGPQCSTIGVSPNMASVRLSVRPWRWRYRDHVTTRRLEFFENNVFSEHIPTSRIYSKGNILKYFPIVTHPVMIWASQRHSVANCGRKIRDSAMESL